MKTSFAARTPQVTTPAIPAIVVLIVFSIAAIFLLAGCSTDAKTLYENKCGSCHTLDVVENASYSDDEWADVVTRMQDKTTTISDSDAQSITEYLAAQ